MRDKKWAAQSVLGLRVQVLLQVIFCWIFFCSNTILADLTEWSIYGKPRLIQNITRLWVFSSFILNVYQCYFDLKWHHIKKSGLTIAIVQICISTCIFVFVRVSNLEFTCACVKGFIGDTCAEGMCANLFAMNYLINIPPHLKVVDFIFIRSKQNYILCGYGEWQMRHWTSDNVWY